MEYNYQGNISEQQPNDYKTWSLVNLIVSIVFCCSCTGFISLILSIIAFIFSNDVSKYYLAGETGVMLAKKKSEQVKTLNIICSVLLAIGIIITIVSIIANGFGYYAHALQLLQH